MGPGCKIHRMDYPFFNRVLLMLCGERIQEGIYKTYKIHNIYITVIEQTAQAFPSESSSQFTKEKQSPDTES